MNLLLLEPGDFTGDNIASINGDRLQHIISVLGTKTGDTLNAGLLNGLRGSATITAISSDSATLQTAFDTPPPAALPLTVILALPRPKMLRRILRNTAELGIKQLYLINSYKVEKSYWQTPFLDEAVIEAWLKDGLVQARDTILPHVHLRKRFKPFVEDELPAIMAGKETFVAHPYNAAPMPPVSTKERVIIIGPEGGFIDYEIGLLQQQGAQAISMGERIYRVENALTLLSTQLSMP